MDQTLVLSKNLDFIRTSPTPFFVFDLSQVKKEYERMKAVFPHASIHYAVKANNHPMLLSTLRDAGSKFEVGGWEEIDLLRQLGVSSDKIIFSAPVKIPEHISRAYSVGVDTYICDSETELLKLSNLAPGSRVLIRIKVSNEQSALPLDSKFGASPEQAVALLRKCLEMGLIPNGIAFHVGSQCTSIDAWSQAMEQAFLVWMESDLPLSCLNIGGGFPVRYDEPVPDLADISEAIYNWLPFFPTGTELLVEPGRKLVATSGILLATVIGKATREGKEWLYLDVGALHGLLESLESGYSLHYPVEVLRPTDGEPGPMKKYIVSGPTCDPNDTILKEAYMTEPEIGNRILISNVGAYSLVYATEFMSLPRPRAYYMLGNEEGGRNASFENRDADRRRAKSSRRN
jgi:ornithine decarboxylase